MANFVLLYQGGSMPESPEEGARVMQAWTTWFGQLGDALIDGGNPASKWRTIAANGSVTNDASGAWVAMAPGTRRCGTWMRNAREATDGDSPVPRLPPDHLLRRSLPGLRGWDDDAARLWVRLAAATRPSAAAKPTCQWKLAAGARACGRPATDGDRVVPKVHGDGDEPVNLQSLGATHHRQKTVAEDRRWHPERVA